MKPRHETTPISLLIVLAFLLVTGAAGTAQAQQVQVTAAVPSSTAQGTINLNVKVTGKGFKNGAKAKWFVTGSTDPGGVQVNSTTFVSSTEVTANITVADTAVTANFDIQVLNSDGRGGKGTELFAVTAKGGGNATCPALQPAPTSDTKCYAALPGCLDSTFGGVGFVHTDATSAYVSSADQAKGVAVQPDGKIVVTGQVRISSTDIDFAVIRYNIDGSPDTSFGDPVPLNPPLRRGYTLTPITTGFDYAYALALQPDGRIVVTGAADGGRDSVVVRYNLDGTLDSTFASGGIAHFGGSAPRSDVALQEDGKIVVAGQGGFGLMRLNSNGSLDSGFGSGGMVSVNASGSRKGSSLALALAIQRVPAITGEERVVVVGWSRLSSTSNQEWTLMRFRSNGATDASFGGGGIVRTYFSGFGDQARRVRIDSSNRIAVAGLVRTYSDSCGSYIIDSGVVRYNQDGTLDGTFGGGKQIVDVYGGDDSLYGLALQPDGKILISEVARSSDNAATYFGLIRFNPDGTLDPTFGPMANGVVTTDLYGTESWAFGGVAVQPTDGKIVVAGSAYLGPNFTDSQIVVARYWP
ncbi:MAG: hypothetical protein ACR2G5_06710 [Pyrinomonadaceae bacterium]